MCPLKIIKQKYAPFQIFLPSTGDITVNCHQVTFDSIGGLKQHIRSLKEMILFPLLYPEVFDRFRIQPPRGVLFFGPPGCGKTLVARGLANECSRDGRRVAFFMRKGADCLSKWVGESERQLRLLFDQVSFLFVCVYLSVCFCLLPCFTPLFAYFPVCLCLLPCFNPLFVYFPVCLCLLSCLFTPLTQAYQLRPSIIFFDEIDGLAPVRSTRQDQIHSSIVSTLLALMVHVKRENGNILKMAFIQRCPYLWGRTKCHY